MCPNKSPRAAIRVSGQPGRRPSPLDGYARRLDCDSGMRRLTRRPVDRQAIASRSPRGGRRPCGCASRSAPRDGAGLRPSQECTHPLPATGWGCGSDPPAVSRRADVRDRRKAGPGPAPRRRSSPRACSAQSGGRAGCRSSAPGGAARPNRADRRSASVWRRPSRRLRAIACRAAGDGRSDGRERAGWHARAELRKRPRSRHGHPGSRP